MSISMNDNIWIDAEIIDDKLLIIFVCDVGTTFLFGFINVSIPLEIVRWASIPKCPDEIKFHTSS